MGYGHDLSLKFLNSTCTFLTLTLFPYAVTNIIRDVYIISIIYMYVPDITVSQKYKQDTYMYKQDTGHAILC